MREKNVCMALLIVAVIFFFNGQERWLTAQDWKDTLYFVNPPIGPNAAPSLITGFSNIEILPQGALLDFKVELEETVEGTVKSFDMTMEIIILGKEIVDGKECTVLYITTRRNIQVLESSFIMTSRQKEWIDGNGIPVKLDVEDTDTEFSGNGENVVLAGLKVPVKTTGILIGEEHYKGHECWAFSITTVAGIGELASKTETVVHLDKETLLMVHKVTENKGKKEVSSYIEPVISEKSTWEMGPRERIDTSTGAYDCQVIYLKKAGELVGTIWVTEDIKTPLKYVYSFETEDSHATVTMTLTWHCPEESYAFFQRFSIV
ncbi:MAG: hypothetical protein AYK18_13225 [Theionarchaea archaeon DG-70]|nr:MAG: hypothetical protein AYK18_13225 [Theionarchaea archaeon DG-70]